MKAKSKQQKYLNSPLKKKKCDSTFQQGRFFFWFLQGKRSAINQFLLLNAQN